jgi:hypothetical protein
MRKNWGIILGILISIGVYAQPQIRGEIAKNVFSEDFIDINQNFPITPKTDPDFWGTYGEGYYYMERKAPREQAVLCKHKGSAVNYSIKTRLQLGPSNSNDQTVGLLFSIQPGGSGGFIFEFNRKKRFRIRDLKGNIITPDDGWVKSNLLGGEQVYEKLEVKCFNYRYECYIDDEFVFAFEDKRFQGGRFGILLGPLAMAKMDFISLYDIEIPGVEKVMESKELKAELNKLKEENEALKEQLILKKYDTEDVAAAKAIVILEQQIEMLRIENNDLQEVVKDYENNPTSFIDSTMEETLNFHTTKILELTEKRDSIAEQLKKSNDEIWKLKSELKDEKKKNDSLSAEIEVLQKKLVRTNEEWVDMTGETEEPTQKEEKSKAKKKEELEEIIVEEKPEESEEEPMYLPLEELEVPAKKSKIKNH